MREQAAREGVDFEELQEKKAKENEDKNVGAAVKGAKTTRTTGKKAIAAAKKKFAKK